MHPEVAYVSALENRLPWLPVEWAGRIRVPSYAGKLKFWFLKGGNAYLARRHLLQKLIPTPVEGEALYRRFGLPANSDPKKQSATSDHGALGAMFSRIRRAAEKTVFVSKRTANNRRLPVLDAMFPTARFVSLKRDGRDVAASLSQVAWWNDHPLWWDPEQRTPLQISAEGEDMLRLCAQNWVAETNAIHHGIAKIDPERVLEVQFEQLVAAPVAEMRRALDFLGLQSSAEYESAITTLGLGLRPGIWHRTWSADQLAMVNREQGPQLERLGYGL
jgi:hypothetical protein